VTTPDDEIERLRVSERLLRLTVANISDAVFLSDDDGKFRYVCPNCDVIFGRSDLELAPGGLGGLFPRPLFEAAELAQRGELANLEARIVRPDGEERALLVNVKRVDILGAKVLTVCRDVTEHRALQRQLRQAQKLEAVGLLAGGVAHDLNNILMVVATLSRSALDHPQSPEAAEDMSELRKAADIGGDLLRKLLTFLRKGKCDPQICDAGKVIEDARGLLAGALRPCMLELEASAEPLWPVRVDPTSLQQVLLNLAINARDAMPDGGTFRVSTRNESVASLRLVACGETLPHGRWVVLTFADTGTGMDEATLERIFDPYFSTKGGERSGLGLSTCFGIVRQAGGYLRVQSRPGAGSRFEIYLPVTEG